MELKSKLRLIAAEITAIAVNAIPLGLWFYADYPAAAAMIIYALESAAAILLAVLVVILASPSADLGGTPKYTKRSKLIGDFLTVSLGMLTVCSVFLLSFLFLILKLSIEFWLVLSGFALVAMFQVGEFLVDLLTLRPLPLRRAEFFLTRSMGRAALLFLGVFLGIFLAAWVDEWFVVPFAVLKTIADIGEPIKFMLGKEDEEVTLNIS